MRHMTGGRSSLGLSRAKGVHAHEVGKRDLLSRANHIVTELLCPSYAGAEL